MRLNLNQLKFDKIEKSFEFTKENLNRKVILKPSLCFSWEFVVLYSNEKENHFIPTIFSISVVGKDPPPCRRHRVSNFLVRQKDSVQD